MDSPDLESKEDESTQPEAAGRPELGRRSSFRDGGERKLIYVFEKKKP
jgi:hypothetical protein